MKITFLVHSLYTIGGTIRTTLNSATALADLGHEIQVVSVFRHRTAPLFALDPRFDVVTLVDARKQPDPLSGTDAALAAKPSKVFPRTEPRYDQYHRLTDVRVAQFLSTCDADVIVGTRPGINVYLAVHAPASAVTVAQEHLFLGHHGRRLTARLAKAYRTVDAVTTVSAADAQEYRDQMPRIADKVRHIPNSIPASPLPPSDCRSHTIVAAGRLEKVKRYDLLLRAFARLTDEFPDWRLRIYGHGKESAALRELSEQLGLHNRVRLMGTYTPIDAEWVKGSIAAVTSDMESFGLTIVEAMNCGLPVVSTACPYGPPEIITDESDGLLTPPDDVEAYAAALRRLMSDEELRRRMSESARKTADRYSPGRIGVEYQDLFTELLRGKGRDVPDVHPTPRAPGDGTVSCRADSFETVLLDLPPAAAPGSVSLVCGTERVAPPAPVDGTITIDRDALAALAPGDWTVHISDKPAPAGRVDGRALQLAPVTPPPTVVVPYSADGEIRLRVRRRPGYPEVGTVDWTGDTLTVTGTWYGTARPDGTGRVTARKDPSRQHPADVEYTGDRFSYRIDTTPLTGTAGKTTLWDLNLPLTDGGEARLGVDLDDIAQRKKSHRLPGLVRDGRRVQPYFTVDNALAIKVSDAE